MKPTLPAHLSGTEPQGLIQNELIAQFGLGDYRNFVYLILDWQSKSAAWVDPQEDIATPIQAMKQYGFTLSRIFLTHTHFDHIAGVPEIMRRFPDVPVHTHEKDSARIPEKLRGKLSLLTEGEQVLVGKVVVHVMHTPGHSEGECSYFIPANRGSGIPPYLFTGDTVFIRDCGRTDLESGSNEEMFQSVQRIKALPPETVILPGHHYVKECATTVKKELVESPPFRCKSVEELASLP